MTDKPNFITRMKTKWDLKTNLDVVLVLIVFTLAGTSVVQLRPVIFNILGLSPEDSVWLKTFLYILFVFPTYQICLLTIGTLLGKFDFFWKKEKQLFKFLFKWVLPKDRTKTV